MFQKIWGLKKCWVQKIVRHRKILCPEISCVLKNFEAKLRENFAVPKFVGPKESKKCLVQILGSEKFWVPKNFGSQTILDPEKFGFQKILGPEKFWVQKKLGPKNCWAPKNF